MTDGESVTQKAKILAVGVIDILIDLLVPTLVYLALAPTHRSAAVRLTVGGFWVAAKSVTGRVREGGADDSGSDDSATSSAAPPDSAARRVVVGLALAVIASAATLIPAYAGAGDTLAIAIGTIVLGAAVIPVLRRRARIDGFALLVLGEVAMSVVLVLISDDPRFILARPAFYTAVAGLYAIATCWTSQPFMMEITRPVAAGGDPVRAAAFDRAWFSSATFRRVELTMTWGLGLVLLAEAVLRVVIVYTQPRDAVVHASVLSQLPSVLLLVGYIAVIRIFLVPVASREVDAEMLNAPTDSPTGTPTPTDDPQGA